MLGTALNFSSFLFSFEVLDDERIAEVVSSDIVEFLGAVVLTRFTIADLLKPQ
jgi:hypothetical protein